MLLRGLVAAGSGEAVDDRAGVGFVWRGFCASPWFIVGMRCAAGGCVDNSGVDRWLAMDVLGTPAFLGGGMLGSRVYGR